MILVNGQPTEVINTVDRAIQFGDGVFETIAVCAGKVLCLQEHLDRLGEGCRRLAIANVDLLKIEEEIGQLVEQSTDCIIKVIVSRGESARGYQIPEDIQSTRIISSTQWQATTISQTIKVCLCQTPLGQNPILAGIKHLNRLEQVLARQEVVQQKYDEGVVLDTQGNVIEGTVSNIFLLFEDILVTPDLTQCGIAGIVRDKVLLLAEKMGLETQVRSVAQAELRLATAMFFTNSLNGIQAVREYCGKSVSQSPIVDEIRSQLIQAQVIPG